MDDNAKAAGNADAYYGDDVAGSEIDMSFLDEKSEE